MQTIPTVLLLSLVSYQALAIPTVSEAKNISETSHDINASLSGDHWIGAYNKSESNYPYGQIDDDEDDEITEDWINNEAHFAPPYSYQHNYDQGDDQYENENENDLENNDDSLSYHVDNSVDDLEATE